MKRAVFALSVMIALVALLATPSIRAQAVAMDLGVVCEYVTDTKGAFDRQWTEGGVTHVRHQAWTSVVYLLPGKDTGTFFGTNAGWESRNVDASGNGDKVGYFNDGTFEGRYTGTAVNGIWSVTFVGHGAGNLLFYGTILEPSSSCEGSNGNLAHAYLLSPHG